MGTTLRLVLALLLLLLCGGACGRRYNATYPLSPPEHLGGGGALRFAAALLGGGGAVRRARLTWTPAASAVALQLLGEGAGGEGEGAGAGVAAARLFAFDGQLHAADARGAAWRVGAAWPWARALPAAAASASAAAAHDRRPAWAVVRRRRLLQGAADIARHPEVRSTNSWGLGERQSWAEAALALAAAAGTRPGALRLAGVAWSEERERWTLLPSHCPPDDGDEGDGLGDDDDGDADAAGCPLMLSASDDFSEVEAIWLQGTSGLVMLDAKFVPLSGSLLLVAVMRPARPPAAAIDSRLFAFSPTGRALLQGAPLPPGIRAFEFV